MVAHIAAPLTTIKDIPTRRATLPANGVETTTTTTISGALTTSHLTEIMEIPTKHVSFSSFRR